MGSPHCLTVGKFFEVLSFEGAKKVSCCHPTCKPYLCNICKELFERCLIWKIRKQFHVTNVEFLLGTKSSVLSSMLLLFQIGDVKVRLAALHVGRGKDIKGTTYCLLLVH